MPSSALKETEKFVNSFFTLFEEPFKDLWNVSNEFGKGILMVIIVPILLLGTTWLLIASIVGFFIFLGMKDIK